MGSTTFCVDRKAPTAQKAFDELRSDALRFFGNQGYTGSISEKGTFRTIECKPENIESMIRELLDDEDHWIDDKWGPAGHIEHDGCHIFFGWASC
jgi:hypothetical protein